MPDYGKSIEEEFIRRALGGFDELANGVYRELGPAAGTQQYTKKQQVALATYTPYPDPVKRQQRAVQLLQQGATIEQVTDELYPRLRPLIELAGSGVRDRIAFAKQLRNDIDKTTPTLQEEIDKQEREAPGVFEQTVLDELPAMEQDDPLLDVKLPEETMDPMMPSAPSSQGMTRPSTQDDSVMPPSPLPFAGNNFAGESMGPIQSTPPMQI